MKALPGEVKHYKSTPIFTEKTVPPGFLKHHNTRNGVWGVICIEKGELEYVIEDKEQHILTPEKHGIVEPKIRHHIRPIGEVQFYVKFYRLPA